jgi:hypothetical protein
MLLETYATSSRFCEIAVGMFGADHVTELERARRPGRRGRGDLFYARWAAEYVEALRESDRPNVVIAERHGYGVSTVRELVHEARHRDLLTPGSRGKAGGSLSDKAIELLDPSEDP